MASESVIVDRFLLYFQQAKIAASIMPPPFRPIASVTTPPRPGQQKSLVCGMIVDENPDVYFFTRTNFVVDYYLFAQKSKLAY